MAKGTQRRPLRVLCVCTHNRTRSVMVGALLAEYLAEAGVVSDVQTCGTASDGQPAMERAVHLLRQRGIDVSDHRSRRLSDELVAAADLILVAERDHVAAVAGRWHGTFDHTFTLPELVARGMAVGPRDGRGLRKWMAVASEGRPSPARYLDDPDVGELSDPTGSSNKVWDASFAEIDHLTATVARLLA